jgi:hypothetical protein
MKRENEVISENLSRLQSSNANFESENVLVKKEISNLRIKCELVEEISRENERLKMHVIALKGDIQSIKGENQGVKGDNQGIITIIIIIKN